MTSSFRILVLADLHLDKWLHAGLDPLAHLAPETLRSIDLCILAGDLTDDARKKWPRAFDWIAERIDPAKCHVFEGNHDYYGSTIDDRGRHAEIAAAHGITYAQKSEIGRGRHRVLCCTLWTDFDLNGERVGAMYDAGGSMNDYKSIRVAREGYRRLRPADTARIHADHRSWLEARLASRFDGETTIVTHHAPHPSCTVPDAPWGPAYASDLTDMIETYRPERWIYGHTHRPHDGQIGHTRIVCASLGYPDEHLALNGKVGIHLFDLAEPSASDGATR